jgi:hypothetical protein
MSTFRKHGAFRKPVESLEQRRLMTVIRGHDVKQVLASDGTRENFNDIVITFDNNIGTSVDTSKIRFFGYSNETLLGGQQKVTIGITSATVSGKTLTLRSTSQVRKGAFLRLNAGAVKDTANADVVGEFNLKKGLNRDRFTLALRAFTPNDKSYFSSSVLSGGRTAIVANTAESEGTVRTQLAAFLDKKVNREKTITAAKRQEMLDKYDNADMKSIIPAHNLRAAVLSLAGTVAEAAIDVWLGTKNTTGKVPLFVGFGAIGSGARDVELSYTSTNRLKLTFKTDYQGESFAALSARFAGETFQDGGNINRIDSQDEEVVSQFVESIVWGQQIVADFTYSQKGTTYTLHNNYHTYVLLNSGDRNFPRPGLSGAPLKSGGTTANPGFISPVRSFDALVRAELAGRISDKPPTPITQVACDILKNCTGQTYTPSTTSFGDDLIANIDQRQGVFSDQYSMRVARVLQVKV